MELDSTDLTVEVEEIEVFDSNVFGELAEDKASKYTPTIDSEIE